MIAGFWRRLAAAAVDALLLGLFGASLGLLWFDRLAALGGLGRLLGAATALAYLGVLDSRIGGGQTLGERLLGVRVAAADGTAIGVPRSTLRAFVLLLPITLHGLSMPWIERHPWALLLQSVLVYGLGGALAYLYAFNRRTRQTLHDLATGTYVLEAEGPAEIYARIWRPHLAVAALWMLAVASTTGPLTSLVGGGRTQERLRAVQRFAESVAPGLEVEIETGAATVAAPDGGTSPTAFLHLRVRTSVEPASYDALADRIAEAVLLLQSFPEIRAIDQLSVSISFGYDILISRRYVTRSFTHTPEEWSQRLPRRSLTQAPRRETRGRRSAEVAAAVDDETLAGDAARELGEEEDDRVRDVGVRRELAQRDVGGHPGVHLVEGDAAAHGLLASPLLEHGPPLPARGDRVDADPERAELA
ncbi:MAG TPA: RDD family protein, partial [Myxococcota bacterium]|nr:RDD family protein [Myxococcota bacterium]